MQNVTLLELLNKYNCLESVYTDNSILVRLDEFPDTNFLLEVDFNDIDIENKFLLICDDFDVDNVLEIILDNTTFRNSIIINKILIKIEMHHRLFSEFYDLLIIYFNLYNKIPILHISSDDDSGFCSYYSLFYTIDLSIDSKTEIFLSNLIEKKFPFFRGQINHEIFYNKYYEIIQDYGWQDFSEKFNLTLNSLSILTLQTKVRRLAYLKMILNLFNESNYYPDGVLNKKIELESKKHNQDLLKHINTKGVIEVTKTGNSSKPYIEAMLSLKLLYSQNNKYQLSKYGKIFNVLSTKLNAFSDNYFILSKYEKAFFLFFILEHDNFYLWALIDIIYIQNNKTTIKNIKEIFQNYIVDQLQFTMKYSTISNKDKAKINSQIKRIKSWKKPQIYLEHIVEPRINWLLDLDILNKNEFLQNNIMLSEEGLTLFSGLNSSFDIFLEKYTLIDQFRCMDYFSLINEMYSIKAVNLDEINIDLIEKYIDESFYLFKTMAPNRVTASQAIIYTCFMVLFKEQKIVNFCTIKNYLSSKKNKKFIFDWYKTENDGSIRKRSDT